ncbi:Protein indeterminate-domain 5 chloroplastic [Bienertia sinuspersici]
MAASSSSSPFFGNRDGDAMKLSHHHQQPPPQPPQQPPQQHSLAAVPPPPPPSSSSAPQQKKKRNPDAEVIALSPKTLMATNRFICEVCNKGFQREQNLQLHRRGHNLPWKLRQKTNKDQVKKKVYLCPEPSCVHHDPARALGDLTGIKKHYSRKHGEKKFKCEKCSKRYAVQSDWKAHSKTRDSFITHRAFCDALAQESARHPSNLTSLGSHLFGPSAGNNNGNNNMGLGVGLPHHQVANHHLQPPSLSDQMTSDILRLGGGARGQNPPNQQHFYMSDQSGGPPPHHFSNSGNNHNQDPTHQNNAGGGGGGGGGIFSNKLFPEQLPVPDLGFYSNNNENTNNNSNNSINPSNTTGSGGDHNGMFSPTGGGNSLFGVPQSGGLTSLYTSGPALQGSSSHMSATALLQKAAQMGSTTSTSNASATALLKGLESKSTTPQPPPPPPPQPAAGSEDYLESMIKTTSMTYS